MKQKIDLSKIKKISLKKRKSRIGINNFAKLNSSKSSFAKFLDSMPDILAASDLKAVIRAVKKARLNKKPIIFMMGAHVIKCGLNPLLIDLMKRGFINVIAFNGACAIHDFELAFCGQTSENVEASIQDGSFGMSKETSDFFNQAINLADKENAGFGFTLGKLIKKSKLKFKNYSLLANAYKYKIPLTVHVAIGTDIIHPHPGCDGAKLGKASMDDFYSFIESVSGLEGGVVFNIGSAVIMPEVFLKAISAARNLKFKVHNFTTVCMDMIKHYRPVQNVMKRPTAAGGQGYYLIGHHEIMIPLLYRALIEG
ncbi:MAG: hypothetical protein ABIG64_07765 [Candidatus Omnitrophota bacterium]